MSTTSETNCFYHPGRPALEDCTECRQPICSDCQMVVAGKTVCQQCVSAIRERVAAEMMASGAVAAQTTPVAQPGAPYAQAPNPPDSGVYQPYAPPRSTHTQVMGAKHVLGGFSLGFLAGIAGLIAWVAASSFLPFNSAIFAVGVGWLIGIAAVKGAGGRGGKVIAMMSALLAFFFCGISVLPSFLDGDWWGWIFGIFCLFFGVQQAYKTPMDAEQNG